VSDPVSDKNAKLHVFMVFATVGSAGGALELELPEQAKSLFSANSRLVVSLADGSALPPWLLFDPRARKLMAKRLPQGALPLEILLKANGQSVLLVVQPGMS
jgi:superfamily II DNA helicase RecQ